MTRLVAITTHDGTVIARDPETGITASGPNVVEALADLRRLLPVPTHARRIPPHREGAAA